MILSDLKIYTNCPEIQNLQILCFEFLNNLWSEDLNCCQKTSIKKPPVLQNIMQKVVKKHKFLALIVANARLFLRKWSILDRYQVHHLCLVYKLQQQLRGKLKTERGQTLSQLQSQTIG